MIKGLSVGTATDVTGSYKLAIPQEEKDFILQFSFVGMKTQEVKYVGKDTINVVLEEEVNTMDEVVITGYQRIDKRKNASSVISVKGSELQEGAAISIDNMLQGKLAGVNIINPTSTPGAAPKCVSGEPLLFLKSGTGLGGGWNYFGRSGANFG